MGNILLYKVQEYSCQYKKIFKGVYDDFKNNSFTDYKFELSPLDYEDYISYVEEGLLRCILLLEDEIPTAFLVYTTAISESIELNMIHCLGDENTNVKRKLLMEKFLEIENKLTEEKVTTYPMMGSQAKFVQEITNYGFNLVGMTVARLNFNNPNSITTLDKYKPAPLQPGYKLTTWKKEYFNDVVKIVHNAFKDTSDAKFDPRFLTLGGSTDIVQKIVDETYGSFIPECTSVILYNDKPVGICFTNITAGKIANVPIIGLEKEHCYKGLGELMLHNSIKNLIKNKTLALEEVNASTETDNYPAVKMYRRMGFKEDYCYPMAYKPIQ